jgi:hypothetical protein
MSLRLFVPTFALLLAVAAIAAAGPRVLIVMDERPQMEVLARYLSEAGGVTSTIVDQASAPADWSGFDAVIGYVHGALQEPIELRIIEYTKAGGRFIGLHHMISSGKSKNRYYFDFLGVRMTGIEQSREPSQPGGHYAWREPVPLTVVNLNPAHFITSQGIAWPDRTPFALSGTAEAAIDRPSFTLDRAEVYLNVQLANGRRKTVLLGMKYLDDRNGALYMQNAVGWLEPSAKGWIVYLQPGHFATEFEHPIVARMILNAIVWKPGT